jgi:hypothetical protein
MDPKNIIAGLAAGAIGILIGHQIVIVLLGLVKVIPAGGAYSLAATGPLAVPRVVNAMFWGGLWGGLMALLWPRLPAWPNWMKGAVFALIFPLLIGSWLVVALIKGQPLMAGFVPLRWLTGFLIYAGWGAAMGLLYPRLAAMMGTRATA